jgi:23S rRNA (uracil1939-C5)-methyltransferase
LLVAGRRIRALQDLAEAITASNSEIVGVGLHLNDLPGNAIYQRDEVGSVPFQPLRGRMYVEEELGGITYRIGPGDFFQTNPSVAELLYSETLDSLGLTPGTPLVDLYSGVGGFALQGARRTGWALGIEELDGAVKRARAAARQNKITAEFIAGEVGRSLDDVRQRLRDSRPVVTVNPARRGLEEGVVEKICALMPRKVAYISCNPKAMARDVAMFRAAGMQVGSVALYDMFPNTPHVESVVLLEATDMEGPARRAPRRKVVKAKT